MNAKIPTSHYTVTIDGRWIVFHQGQPLMAPGSPADAYAIAKRFGLVTPERDLPLFCAATGEFVPDEDDDEPSVYKPEAAVLYDGTPGSASIRRR